MIDPNAQKVTASLGETNKLAKAVLNALAEEEASIGMGLLACSLTIGRLLNPGKELSDETEIAFIEALMDWSGAYFTTGEVAN